ncbi:MAG TPA: ABC transporter permease [Candidatus Acidoferrales bacterium]
MSEGNTEYGEHALESSRNRRGLRWLDTLLQDVRFGARMLRKNPGFSVVCVLTLALGIGASTAIFTVVNKVLLQPMVYPDPDRVVMLMQTYQGGNGPIISIPKYMMWRDQTQLFEDAAVYDFGGARVNLTGGDQPEQLKGMHVSANFFSLVGIQLAAGRTFTGEEDIPGGPQLAVISNGLWRGRFGSDPHMIGRTIELDNAPYNVIGVMSPFYSPDLPDADVYIPLQADPNTPNQGNYMLAAARLKPGVKLAQAKAAMKVVAEQFRRKYPTMMDPHQSFTVETVREALVAGVRTALLILLGAVGFVLLIACANVANLMLARALLRKREISIRVALGAGRGRIIRQVLTESVLLALAGGALGVFIGYFGVRSLLAINPGNIPRIGEHAQAIALDWRVLAFALAISLLTGIVAGIIPAIKASRTDLAATMKESGARAGTGLRQSKMRSVLVGIEMALAMILLIGAALLVRTFYDLRTVNPGFETHKILTMDMSIAGQRFAKSAAVGELAREGQRRLENLPGVEAATVSCCLPLAGGYGLPFNIEGRAPTTGPYTGGGPWRSVSSDYFSVLHIPLLRGRTFTERDGNGTEPVVVINEAMAKQYWPKGGEIGARITIGKGMGPMFDEPAREIIGVVGDVRDNALNFNPIPTMYVPVGQVPDGMNAVDNGILPMIWLVHTKAGPYTVSNDVQRELRIASGGLPVGNIRSMEKVEEKSTAGNDFNTTLLTIFACVALVLAGVGIYGNMAYSVQQRTQEIGIRMTLGATPAHVHRMVILHGMILAGIGVLIGVGGGLALTRVMRSLLFGVKPWDPVMFLGTAILLGVIALVACWIPARRATRVDPMVALRYE